MNNCAETMTRYCKAYFADCWGNVSECYNRCRTDQRPILKQNINNMIDRLKVLLNDQDGGPENGETD